jgi:hypothetical protein
MNQTELIGKIKESRQNVTLAAFALVALVTIIVGYAAFKQPIVPICVSIILEAMIAVFMHNAELWIHGVLILVELIVGILIGRTGMIVLCVIIYAAATAALRFLTLRKD